MFKELANSEQEEIPIGPTKDVKTKADALVTENNATKIRKNLMLLVQSGSDNTKQSKELQLFVGNELTRLLLEINGVANLMVACNDLGGESFWTNSAALTAIVELLSKKPTSVKSVKKYYAYILRHMLLLFKDKRWNKNLALLFYLLINKFVEKSPQVVLVHFVDKFTHPFEVLLERGNLIHCAEEGYVETAQGLWNKHLDEAVWIIARWLESLPSTSVSQFPFCDRLLRIFPFLMHLLGQAHEVVKHLAGNEANSFLQDMAIIQDRLLHSFSTSDEQAEYLVEKVFQPSEQLESSSKHAYFELNVLPVRTSLVEPVEQSSHFNYDMVNVSVRQEAFSLQDVVDFKFSALRCYLKSLSSEENYRLLFSMLSAIFAKCKKSPMETAETQDAIKSVLISSFRFVQADKKMLSEDEDAIFSPHYVLTRIVELLTEFDFTGLEDKLDEKNLLNIVDFAEEITECYKNKMNLSHNKDGICVPTSLDSILTELDDYSEPALVGHTLIVISEALRLRDNKLFSETSHFNIIYDKLIEKLQSDDTYIFLAAINALAELAYWKTSPFLGNLVELFVNWQMGDTKTEINLYKTEKGDMTICKLGEALSKVCRQLGDFSPMYFDAISNSLLAMIEHSADDLTRASSLCSLADLVVACKGRYFDRVIHELLLCVSQLLSSSSALTTNIFVRRSAINLLRSMVVSATMSSNVSIFETFASSMTEVSQKLKRLWSEDEDDVVRLHSELALLEIQDAVKRFFSSPIERGSEIGMRKIL